MKKRAFIIFSIFLACILLYSFLMEGPPKPYYDTRELAISSLLSENTYILKTIPVAEHREIIVFYDKVNEAIFIATICEDKDKGKFIVEKRTNAWKVEGESSIINGVYNVEDVDVTVYAWKGFDKLISLINENQVINQNKDKINKYDRDLYLLVLIDEWFYV